MDFCVRVRALDGFCKFFYLGIGRLKLWVRVSVAAAFDFSDPVRGLRSAGCLAQLVLGRVGRTALAAAGRRKFRDWRVVEECIWASVLGKCRSRCFWHLLREGFEWNSPWQYLQPVLLEFGWRTQVHLYQIPAHAPSGNFFEHEAAQAVMTVDIETFELPTSSCYVVASVRLTAQEAPIGRCVAISLRQLLVVEATKPVC